MVDMLGKSNPLRTYIRVFITYLAMFFLLNSPGRFFAVNELKAMMVHILLNYDVKLEDEGVRPPNEINGLRLAPNREAKVLFRKRRANKN